MLNPYIFHPGMKNKYPIQVIHLRFQVDHISPKKLQLFEEVRPELDNVIARIYVILFRPRQVEKISNGNKIIEIEFI